MVCSSSSFICLPFWVNTQVLALLLFHQLMTTSLLHIRLGQSFPEFAFGISFGTVFPNMVSKPILSCYWASNRCVILQASWYSCSSLGHGGVY